jgi:hypothetical protein
MGSGGDEQPYDNVSISELHFLHDVDVTMINLNKRRLTDQSYTQHAILVRNMPTSTINTRTHPGKLGNVNNGAVVLWISFSSITGGQK